MKTRSFLMIFLLSCGYWLYLLFSTQMVIIWDGATYQKTAQILVEGGWGTFFKTGPHNEPVYPWLISSAMHLAQHLPWAYDRILAFFQICILAIVQVMVWRILNQMNVRASISAVVLCYLGFSPAIVNAGLSHWSEITAMPFVVGILLSSLHVHRALIKSDITRLIAWGTALAFMFIGATCVKALFELVFYFYMAVFLVLLWKSKPAQAQGALNRLALVAVVVIGIFAGFTYTYKSANNYYNGHFMMADRGPYIFYGNTVKRTNDLTLRGFLASVAFIPGDGVCHKIFGEEECSYWTLQQVDHYGYGKLKQLQEEGLRGKDLDKTLLQMGVERVNQKPLQYAGLTFLEGFKIFFWESTHVGFVRYPVWLSVLFDNVWFKNMLRLLVVGLTFIAMFYWLWRIKKLWVSGPVGLVLIFALWFPFVGLYSLFFIHTRYMLPIVPLYLVLIACFLDRKKADG